MTGFSANDRASLMAAPFVGPRVVQRLEEAGFSDLAALARADAGVICAQIAASLGTSCWANSPQARRAIENAIAVARAAS